MLSELEQLKDMGLSIALDDFGTGFSSLSYLRMFPFNKIKVDKSFVSEIATRSDSAAIVGAVAGLARSLGIITTAEGVETADQLAMVKAAGCVQGQGYFFGKPEPISVYFPESFAVATTTAG
jgi:EAL domain-containing protein (putative c-di-GMP-specific phosphodiesterase class I)